MEDRRRFWAERMLRFVVRVFGLLRGAEKPPGVRPRMFQGRASAHLGPPEDSGRWLRRIGDELGRDPRLRSRQKRVEASYAEPVRPLAGGLISGVEPLDRAVGVLASADQ